jgi:hypothetical protein
MIMMMMIVVVIIKTNFHVHLDNYKSFSPTDAQLGSLKDNFKFALKFTLNCSFNFIFNANLKLFLKLSNCTSVGEKNFDNKKKIWGYVHRAVERPARFLTHYSYIDSWCSRCFIVILSPLSRLPQWPSLFLF